MLFLPLLVGCLPSHATLPPAECGTAAALPVLAAPDPQAPLRARLPETVATPDASAKPTYSYRALTPETCQRLAVQSSTRGNEIDSERLALERPSRCCLCLCSRPDEKSDLQQAVLFYSAQEARNASAGGALEAFFRLAELEASAELLHSSVAELEKARTGLKSFSKTIGGAPVTPETLHQQRLEMEEKVLALQASTEELRVKLGDLLGMSQCAPTGRLVPTADWDVCEPVIDVDAVVAEGLAHRPQLLLLRKVSQDLDATTLPQVKRLLQGENALLGSSSARGGLCKLLDKLKASLTGHRDELEERRQQVQQLVADRERAVREEIQQAIQTLHERTDIVALVRQRVESLQKSLKDAESRFATLEEGSFLEVSNAKLALYKGLGDLVHAIMDWHIAKFKIRQAQGMLVEECSPVATDGLGGAPAIDAVSILGATVRPVSDSPSVHSGNRPYPDRK
jgi:hypothetical protein